MARSRALLALSLVLPLVVVATPGVAEAASITVTTTADTVADDGQTSLREAISAANDDSGSTTITLAASTYEISLGCGGDEDANAGGDLDITTIGTVVLQGPSAASRATITLGGSCSSERLIDVTLGSTVTLRNLVLTGGRAPTRSNGGAVRAPQATLAAEDVTFSNNAAGDASIALGASNVGGGGGAIWAEVSLSLTRCTFTANSAGDGYLAGVNTEASSGGLGGAVALQGFGATLSVVDSTFTSNTSGTGGDSSVVWSGNGGNGGAIAYVGTSLTITGSTFTGNVAGSGGRSEGDRTGVGGQGGAVAIISRPGATVDIMSSTFTGNVSGAGGSSSVQAGGGGGGVRSGSSSTQVTVSL
jgi:CSLREA domain-containing protein